MTGVGWVARSPQRLMLSGSPRVPSDLCYVGRHELIISDWC